MNLALADEAIVARTDGLLASQVGDVVVILHMDRSAYFHTDAIGADIWHRMAEPRRVGDLIADLVEDYEIDRDTCARDVRAFLAAAITEGVVRQVEL